jgi:sporulation protein YunB
LAVCLVLIGICIFLEHAARPQIRALSEIAARKEATTALNTAVEEILREEEVEYASLVHIVSSQAGISSIASDTYEINLLKGRIVDAVEEQISKSRIKLSLPLGTLLGSELFAGTGPNIPVSLRMQGHVAATVKSDLSSSGVNQTMHRILLPLTVELNVILPGEGLETEFETTVCLAETVIVGDVPTGLITGSAP